MSSERLTCDEVRAVLSDWIDVHRGECPAPEATPLAKPAFRSAVETHLDVCAACREELRVLEEIGAAYADFSVNEAVVQDFADYGQKVRARMAQQQQPKVVTMPRRRRFWTRALSATAAAAVMAVILIQQYTGSSETTPTTNASAAPRKLWRPAEQLSLIYPRPSPTATRAEPVSINYGLEPAALKKLQDDEWKMGYLVVGERPQGEDQRPLLGVFLKTTRDADKVSDHGFDGLQVMDVLPGSPAHHMGLMKNDFIIDYNGNKIENGGIDEVIRFFAELKKAGEGSAVRLLVIRTESGQVKLMKPMEGVLGEYREQ